MRVLGAWLALLVVVGCGGRGECPRGEHAACACADGRGGAKTCTDGRWSPCVCTTLIASPPSVRPKPAPTPGATQELVPDPYMIPTLPPAQRDAAIDAWVHGPLRGRDNDMAHLRGVTITRRADGTFGIAIRNQFRWTCVLEFDTAGRPSTMRHCTSASPGWYADPDELHFQCLTNDTDEVCEAPYTLGERTVHMRDPSRFRILRPLVPPRPSPPTPPRPIGPVLFI